jgi:pyrroloquinoline quinone biosynthesis protein B
MHFVLMPLKLKSLFFCVLCLALASKSTASPYLLILGTAQDGGYPHMGCAKEGCNLAWKYDSLRRYVVSFALVDSTIKKWWLFEATPDIKYQLQLFKTLTKEKFKYLPDGIFITHAHIGHYTGLMELGREVMDSKEMPTYVLPKMKLFLETNGPWSQLVKLKNIAIHTLNEDTMLDLGNNIRIETFKVVHRDEYSETAGFRINTGAKKYLFIPDINKWEKWDKKIIEEVKKVDVALLDATFYSGDELPNRKISEVPHPLISETMMLFKNESKNIQSKIYFIHFNHTNPILWDMNIKEAIKKQGFNISEQGEIL